MRYAIPILFLILALFALQSWINQAKQATPSREAIAFLSALRTGNLSRIVRHFGDNTCHCPKSYGWGSYLAYQTGQETNLTFLLGHPFTIGQPVETKIESPPQAKHGIPWEHPDDYIVELPIQFNSNKYSPIFLPLPMAYGKNMTWKELQNFMDDPDQEATKAFSLRLRPSLSPNAITFDGKTIESDVRGEFKFLKIATNTKTNLKTKTEENQTAYPQEAGKVLMPDNSIVPREKLEEILPRLKATTMRLHIVRRSKLEPWTIFHFALVKSTLEESQQQKLITVEN